VSHEELIGLGSIILLGVAAQWLAWRFGLASILTLLVFGFLAGPVTGFLDPDELFGDLLLPGVSIAVALILYEGGLSLRFEELKKGGAIVWRLVSIGALITWAVVAAAAWLTTDLPVSLAILLGAVLVVTGPTVIGPILQHLRPTGPVGPALKWEGIVIDPLGAMLAVLVFEIILIRDVPQAAQFALLAIGKTVFISGIIGVAAAMLLAVMLRYFWIPDYLDNPVSVMLVVGVYVVCEQVQPESGLFGATVMGVALANQKLADVRHIVEFKEDLRTLLISTLFILLAARLDLDNLRTLGWGSLAFLGIVIVIARPLSVWTATVGSNLKGNDRTFLACMAPRGIVAASVASVFALRLDAEGFAQADLMVPLAFLVIGGTVFVYGFSARPVAQYLGIAEPNPQGVLFVGATEWIRKVAALLQEQGFRVRLVDTNWENLRQARMAGLPTHADNVLAEELLNEIDLGGLGKVIAATPNDWVNILALQRFEHVFGRANVYRLHPRREESKATKTQAGRVAFPKDVTYGVLARRIAEGAEAKATPLTEDFPWESFQKTHGERAIPLFIITQDKELYVYGKDQPKPKAGQTVISLVKEQD